MVELALDEMVGAHSEPDKELRRMIMLYDQYLQNRMALDHCPPTCYLCRWGCCIQAPQHAVGLHAMSILSLQCLCSAFNMRTSPDQHLQSQHGSQPCGNRPVVVPINWRPSLQTCSGIPVFEFSARTHGPAAGSWVRGWSAASATASSTRCVAVPCALTLNTDLHAQ